MSRFLPAMSAFVVLALLEPRVALASELDEKMEKLAGQLATLVKDKKQNSVAMGEIIPVGVGPSNSGAGFQKMLAAELKKHKVSVDEDSHYTITGKYLAADGKDDKGGEVEGTTSLRLIITLLDKQARQQGEFSCELPVNKPGVTEELAKRLPVQTELGEHKKALEKEHNKKLSEDREKPPLHLDDCAVKTTKESPFAVTVLVRRKGQTKFVPVKPTDKNGKGRAFVELKDGDVYRLELSNDSKIEAVASILIDGVDALEFFEPANNRPGSFLIPKEGKRTVNGWRKSKEKSTEFLVGKFADSVNAKMLKGSASLGTIVVCFHHCWEGDKAPEAYDGSRSGVKLGTGQGDEIKDPGKVVKRTIGPLHTSIVIRYDK